MGEAVTIISVAASGAVGLGGLASTVWGARRERWWKSREERTVNLRDVLDEAIDAFTHAMFIAGHGFKEIETTGKLSDERKAELADAQKRIVLAGNRLGVRVGASSDVRTKYTKCMAMFVAVSATLEQARAGLTPELEANYHSGQASAVEAEREYLDAASEFLMP